MKPDFSTEFFVSGEHSVSEIIQLACEWICGSPHTKINNSSLTNAYSNLMQGNSADVERKEASTDGSEIVTLRYVKQNKYEIGGVEYIKFQENKIQWTTYIVCEKNIEKFGEDFINLSIQTSSISLTTAQAPKPKKPVFIKLAFERLKLGSDGEIPLSNQPYYFSSDNKDDLEGASDIIEGKAKNRLPIIYISTTKDNKYLIGDIADLTKEVSGMAHVFVEPNRDFSFKLKEITNSKNVYLGSIGIYWPNSNAKKVYYQSEDFKNIGLDIVDALRNRQLIPSCTWGSLNEKVQSKKLELLKETSSIEQSEYLSLIDEIISEKERLISELKQCKQEYYYQETLIDNLRNDMRGLKAKTNNGGVIEFNGESDLYEGEIKNLIIESIEALCGSLNCNHEKNTAMGRKIDLLKTIIRSNQKNNFKEELLEELKNIFRGYTSLTPNIRSTLERHGFNIESDTNHYKIRLNGDRRYSVSFAKTASDRRAGDNIVRDIKKMFF